MSLEIGQHARFATPTALVSGPGQGSYSVVGGVLAWDPRFDQVPQGMIPLGAGYARVGSARAATGFYVTAMELRAETNRLHEWFVRAAGPGWRFGMPVPARADELLTVLVNAEIQWGTAMRLLGLLYRAANLPTSARPSAAAAAGVDLQQIRYYGKADPLSRGVPTWVTAQRPAAWQALGAAHLGRWIEAYPDRARPALAGAEALQADIARQNADIAATMGALVEIITLVVVLVGIGVVAVLLNRSLGAVAAFMGMNLEYQRELNQQLAQAFEDCRAGDDAACEQWREIAGRIEALNPPLGALGRIALVGGVAALLIFLYRRR